MTVLTEIVEDRRRMARQKRLITLSLTLFSGGRNTVSPETQSIVTTDLSLTGAFLSVSQGALPPRGSRVRLQLLQGDRTIYITACVVRTVQRPSPMQRVRGIGVAFTQIEASGGITGLRDWLKCMLHGALTLQRLKLARQYGIEVPFAVQPDKSHHP